ncbi:unnamed protein product [Taenia asiatica]|uniref:MARVEL domain-containing protein n=1 Tax=Taenia asiatica TaxID=60517 RepID=A0A0R3VZI2_TAEAS|nr:unnamed protein product [Taenia asiatica]
MDRKVMYTMFALAATFLFCFAIGFDGWRCGGSILSPKCRRLAHYELTAFLLLAAGVAAFIASIFCILPVLFYYPWSSAVACVFAVISAALSMVGVVYHTLDANIWSPTLASAAVALTVALATTLFFDLALISKDKRALTSSTPSKVVE